MIAMTGTKMIDVCCCVSAKLLVPATFSQDGSRQHSSAVQLCRPIRQVSSTSFSSQEAMLRSLISANPTTSFQSTHQQQHQQQKQTSKDPGTTLPSTTHFGQPLVLDQSLTIASQSAGTNHTSISGSMRKVRHGRV